MWSHDEFAIKQRKVDEKKAEKLVVPSSQSVGAQEEKPQSVGGLTMIPQPSVNPISQSNTDPHETHQQHIRSNTSIQNTNHILSVIYIHLGKKVNYRISYWTQEYLDYYIKVNSIIYYKPIATT